MIMKVMILAVSVSLGLRVTAWKLFRYLPGRPTCDGPGKDKWIGCQKLAEQSG